LPEAKAPCQRKLFIYLRYNAGTVAAGAKRINRPGKKGGRKKENYGKFHNCIII
jgi:hypothetical protein